MKREEVTQWFIDNFKMHSELEIYKHHVVICKGRNHVRILYAKDWYFLFERIDGIDLTEGQRPKLQTDDFEKVKEYLTNMKFIEPREYVPQSNKNYGRVWDKGRR